MLAQKKFESRSGRDKTKDLCNYDKEVGDWARESKKIKVDLKKKSEQNNNVETSDVVIGEAFMYAPCLLP